MPKATRKGEEDRHPPPTVRILRHHFAHFSFSHHERTPACQQQNQAGPPRKHLETADFASSSSSFSFPGSTCWKGAQRTCSARLPLDHLATAEAQRRRSVPRQVRDRPPPRRLVGQSLATRKSPRETMSWHRSAPEMRWSWWFQTQGAEATSFLPDDLLIFALAGGVVESARMEARRRQLLVPRPYLHRTNFTPLSF